MAVLAENGRTNFWFGTIERMGWFPTPNRGADVSPEGWDAGGPLLSGGAYQFNSFGSAKNYSFEWPASSTRQHAQLMKSYSEGSFGRGLIYFLDPLTYLTNILPAMWADPSMGIGDESFSLIPGVKPTGAPSSAPADLMLPTREAVYDTSDSTVSFDGSGNPVLDDSNSVFIPIPEGHSLLLGGVYSSSNSEAGVYFSNVTSTGAITGAYRIPTNPGTVTWGPGTDWRMLTVSTSLVKGVRLWIGSGATSPGGVISVNGLSARLLSYSASTLDSSTVGPAYWMGGQGHSGCRFSGRPTYLNQTGVNGGQVSFAATFREVGSWVNG